MRLFCKLSSPGSSDPYHFGGTRSVLSWETIVHCPRYKLRGQIRLKDTTLSLGSDLLPNHLFALQVCFLYVFSFWFFKRTRELQYSACTTSQIQHVIPSNNHIANSTKCHFHGPKQGNNQRGKIPHLLKCVGSVLDPHKSETMEEKASSSLSPFFLSSCFLFFLPFFSFFISLFSFFSSCLRIVCHLPSNYQVGLT